ncbi:MAG TPA: tetratricopeptide repeat protein, partial [Roseiflexaceae bacterium]|nr:tetratricopeptide repeat protein [Roseiflexaceae bacterium]
DATTADDLLSVADRRHYQAKRAGRAQVVAADRPPVDPAAIEPPSRLIERDGAMEALHSFLDALPEHGGGVLHVSGEVGCGFTGFLAAACEAARVRRFAAISLRGSPALRSRIRGALAQIGLAWPDLPPPALGVEVFAQALARQLARGDQGGLVVALDDAHDVDQETHAFLFALLTAPHAPPVGLIYAAPGPAPAPPPPARATLQRRIRLAPLSPAGLRTWVRHSLAWEIPDDLLAWLHQATGGLPGRIWAALRYLVDHALLTPAAGGWRAAPDLTALDLAAQPGFHRGGPPHNLPASLPEFVGREEEMRALTLALASHRLVALVGTAGQGKTRLALQAAAESLPAFADGVFFVDLTALTADDVPTAIARALGLALLRGTDARALLLATLCGRTVLLVLDDVDRPQGVEPLLEQLLTAAPRVRLLVTSRERPALAGAAIVELRGLAVPPDAGPQAEEYSALQLFVRSARQVAPDFVLTAESRAAAVRLCQLVNGLPLALTLAAAWARTHTCEEIVRQVEHNLAQLDASLASGERHAGLIAVAESFWQQISAAERRSLRRLAVFRGGFSAEAAADVAGASRFFLSSLVASGYLHFGPHRLFTMHELLRQYASAQLARALDEALHARDAHAAYYTVFVEQHAEALLKDPAAAEALTRQLDNIRAAYDWAVAQGLTDLVERCTTGLARLYTIAGYVREGAAVFASAAQRLEPQAAESAARLTLTRLRVEHMRMLVRLDAYDQILAIAPLVAAAAGDLGALDLAAAAYTCWGEACVRGGDAAQASALLAEAARFAAASGSTAVQVDTLYALAVSHSFASDYRRASEYFAQGLELSRAAGYRRSESRFLNGLGLAEYQHGNYGGAWRYFEQALPMFRALNDRQGEALVLSNLAEAARHIGDYPRCRAYNDLTLRISRAVGDQLNECEALICQALCLSHQGEHAGALALSRQALQLAEALGARIVRSRALTAAGAVLLAAGQLAEAEARYEEALARWLELGQEGRALEPRGGLVAAALAAGDDGRAYARALQLADGLARHRLDGAYEPARTYLVCIQALQRCGDPRAETVRDDAAARLCAWLAAIDDPHMRHTFLTAVEANRALAELCGERVAA